MAARPLSGGSLPTNEILMLGLRLQGKTGLTDTQRGYARIAAAFAGRLPMDRGLAIDVMALRLLSDPRTPAVVRDVAVGKALNGERVTRKVVEDMIARQRWGGK
jgi:hypothetical protein